MPRFFSNKRLILLLVGVIVLVALISFSLKDRQNASLPEQIVKDVVGFGQSLFSKPAHYITNVIGNIDGILNTYEENKHLKVRLSEYASEQAELTDVKAENERLLEIVGKKDDLRDYEPVHATVISRNPDQWEEKIIIDKGEVHGIEKNMAVITANGLDWESCTCHTILLQRLNYCQQKIVISVLPQSFQVKKSFWTYRRV